MRALLGIIGFTVVETAGLIAWLVLAGVPFNGKVVAAIVLFLFLLGEHITAYNVGTGRPFFSIPLD